MICNCCAVRNLINKQTFNWQSWNLVTKRKFSISKGSAHPNVVLSKCNESNKFHNVKVRLDKNNPDLIKKFSTSSTVWLHNRGQNDRSERLKNYAMMAFMAFLVLSAVYFQLTMEIHRDYVYIEPEPEDKKENEK